MIIVSIIIPAKNRSFFTEQALRSVFTQRRSTNTKLEVIVVDNGSTPSLEKVLGSQFPQVKFLRYTHRQHPGAARNYGLKYASGDYIAFLDSDDQWLPEFLYHSLNALSRNPAPASVCLTHPYFYGPYPLKAKIKLVFLNLIRTAILLTAWVFNQGKLPPSGFYLCQISHMLINAKSIKNLNFNESVVASEDWELIADLSRRQPILIVPLTLVDFRYEIRSNTNADQVRREKWNAYRNLIRKLPTSHKQGLLHKFFLSYIKSFS